MQRFLIALILLLSFDGQAVVRLMPRNDYEHIGPVRPFLYPKELLNLTNGIDDFFSGVRDLLSDQHIGGDFDLVYQEDQTLTHIYSCPSIRFCMKDKLPGSTPTDNTPSSPLAALFHISMPAVSSKMTAAEPSTNDQQLIMVDLDNTENAQLSSCLDPNKHPEAWQCKELIVAPK